MKKIVLTGAGGRLGSLLRKPLLELCDVLISSDIVDDIGVLHENEHFVQADIADYAQVHGLLDGADMVVHFGAFVDEGPFEKLLGPNFVGAYNVWEAAFQLGLKRVVYASSIHAVGMHKSADKIGIDAPHKPDTFYGLAKCFTEDMASMYWDKRQLESVCLRILTCPDATTARSLGTWLSENDLIHLVERAVLAPNVGFSVIFGVSNNDRAPVRNDLAKHIGYEPKDNAEKFAGKILVDAPAFDPNDPAQTRLGGPFATIPLGTGVMEQMAIPGKEDE
jgi:uronate dehydrogenase